METRDDREGWLYVRDCEVVEGQNTKSEIGRSTGFGADAVFVRVGAVTLPQGYRPPHCAFHLARA